MRLQLKLSKEKSEQLIEPRSISLDSSEIYKFSLGVTQKKISRIHLTQQSLVKKRASFLQNLWINNMQKITSTLPT